MNLDASDIVGGLAVGVGATVVMDLWNLFLKRGFGIPSLDYCLLGRWVLHLPEGTVRHASIRAAEPKPSECTAGWLAHYSIGIVLALGLVVITSGRWLAQPTLPIALGYGIATLVFPFFVLQPSLGFGVASSRAPSPAKARLKSLATHLAFGFGLYASAAASALLRRGP